jgi:F0F1-type ATP synthase membrane subunit b/b'
MLLNFMAEKNAGLKGEIDVIKQIKEQIKKKLEELEKDIINVKNKLHLLV